MANGWESKSVEEQKRDATDAKGSTNPRPTPEEVALDHTRQELALSRQRVLEKLQSACNPHHRSMLEKALAGLEETATKLG